MPRVRRRRHVLVQRNTPACWAEYFSREIRAKRFPLRLPKGRLFALLGLRHALGVYDRERRTL